MNSTVFVDTVSATPPVNLENPLALIALVVDDSMLIRHTVCRFLEERGFVTEMAGNGMEALEVLQKLLPDVIITDLNMPKMDGNELIDRLKSSPATAAIPVIVLKGKNSKSDLAYDPRAEVAIFKDIEIIPQLEQALKSALEKKAPAN